MKQEYNKKMATTIDDKEEDYTKESAMPKHPRHELTYIRL